MLFTVYILFSKSTQKYYTGSTQDLQNRLLEHNSAETKSIRNGIPWEVIWQTQVPSRAEALNLETKIKKRVAKRFIEDQSRGA
jgi:putative endonuclease